MPHLSSFHRQRIAVLACVLLFHVLALWALQTGLLQRMVDSVEDVVVPVALLTEPPPQPTHQPLPTPESVKKEPLLKPTLPAAPPVPAVVPTATAVPTPLAIADAPPSANAPTGVAAAAPAVAPAAVATVAAATPKVELPSSNADYLHNPKPIYPRLSERRNEQGTVILHVLVAADGRVRDVSVKSSSGFERLDQAAREAVQEWTFVPGKRNGAAVEMVVDVPIRFKPSE
jgi:protein TonB